MISLKKNWEIDIPYENPFINDNLKREEEIQKLTKLIDIIDPPFTLAINGGWGTGKTSFIKMWEQYLKKQKYTTLNYNAWENDSSEYPLLTIMGEIQDQIVNNSTNLKVKSIAKALFKSTTSIVSKGIESSILATSSNLVHFSPKESIDEFTKNLGSAPSEYVKYKKSRKKFQDALIKFAEEVGKNKSNNKVICFIDELDRCRPNFAVELLENIKHFLNVENYIFIISLDKIQLGYSISTLYGSQMDSEGYLKRFIDFSYNLRETDTSEFTRTVFTKIFDEPFEKRELRDDRLRNIFLQDIELLIRGFHLSLREIEQLLFHLKLIFKKINYDSMDFYVIPILLIMRHKNYPMYKQYIKKEIMFDDFINYIKSHMEWDKYFSSERVNYLLTSICESLELLHLSRNDIDERMKNYNEESHYGAGFELRKFAQKIREGRLVSLQLIYEKIETVTILETN